ncbi:alanine racemase [Patescibacteria group bacterium]
MNKPYPWLEINLENLKYNVNTLKSFLDPKVKFMAVVKSNAYGHGMVQIAKEASVAGADWFGVFTVEEALKLRKNRLQKPILVFGPVSEDDIRQAVAKNITLTVYNRENAKLISKIAIKARKACDIHIKVNTGMNRLGIDSEEAVDFVKYIKRLPKVNLDGIYSHFAAAGSTNRTYTFKQLGTFQELIIKLDRLGLRPPVAHIANSAAALEIPSSHLDLVRCGIAIYGLFSNARLSTYFDLKPVLEFKTQLIEFRKLSGGEKVSYDCTYTTPKPTLVGIVPVGYTHGYDFKFSNRGKMLLDGRRAPVIGRVCMEFTLLDITDIPDAKTGDEVIILGKQGNENITAGELAGYLDSINYETVTKIPESVKRIYVRNKTKEKSK